VTDFNPTNPSTLTEEEENELNQLDKIVSESLLKSEKALATLPTYWWSDILHKRHLIVKYWKLNYPKPEWSQMYRQS
jgi:hypothetical protein